MKLFLTDVPREVIQNRFFFCGFLLIFFYWCVVWSRFFLLTQTARLSGPFRYLEHVRKVNRKFSRGLWKKVSAQKMGFCQNIPTRFWASFFQNLNFFHFSWHIIRLVSRMVTIFFYWSKDQGWADLSITFNMFVKSTETFLKPREKQFQSQKWVRNEVQNTVRMFLSYFLC